MAVWWQQVRGRESFVDDRIPAWWGLEGTCGDSPVQPLCQSRVTQSRLHKTLSRRVLNISREGDSTTSLGSLGQCSVTLRGKKFFLTFSWNFLGFGFFSNCSCSCVLDRRHTPTYVLLPCLVSVLFLITRVPPFECVESCSCSCISLS